MVTSVETIFSKSWGCRMRLSALFVSFAVFKLRRGACRAFASKTMASIIGVGSKVTLSTPEGPAAGVVLFFEGERGLLLRQW